MIFPPNSACPWLPEISSSYDWTVTRRHGRRKGAEFYYDALCYAQSLWIERKPAQAILQLNKAWMSDLTGEEGVLESHPAPYLALVWLLETAIAGDHGYLGNPVRHFQHLATRVSGAHSGIRAWRAWLCFHLAEKSLPTAQFPRDGKQLAREGLVIPNASRAIHEITKNGWGHECPQPLLELLGYP